MKITIKLLLIGATLASTTIAIISNSKLKEQKIENHKMVQKLESTENNLKKQSLKNKKLSKRVIKEINKIINLNDSVKDLDENLKEDQEKLLSKTQIAEKLSSKNKKLRQKALKAEHLEKEIHKSKKEILAAKKEISAAKQLKVSNIVTTIMRKKKNGAFTQTLNNKKIDAFKTNFQILNNEIANSGKKKIYLKIYNSKNQSLKFTDELNVEYNNKNIDIVSIIEVERSEIVTGNYEIIAYIDNKKVKSSSISVN